MKRNALSLTIAGTALALAAGSIMGCDDNGEAVVSTNYAYDDAYLYTGYYPADVAYASSYWAYPYDLGGFYYFGEDAAQTATHTGIAAAVKALARGEQVCPGQVTVSEKKSAVVCAANAAAARAGATITFNNCNANGGTINGSIDITGTATASDQSCSATTTIMLSHTSTFTNLSFTTTDGRKIVIPNQTNTGMTNFTFGATPTMTTINANGEIQIVDTAGATAADLTFMGDNTFTFSGTQSYSVSGTTTVSEKSGGATATITRSDLVRSGGCCRPTSGSISVNRTGGILPGTADWSFGPSCGQVMRNGTSAQMPACL
jgi:hypothetical protein